MRYTELLLEDVGMSFGQHIKSLQSKQAQLSMDDPQRSFIQHLLDTANEILNSDAQVQMEAVAPAPSQLTSPSAQTTPQPMNMPPAQPAVAPVPRKKQPAPSSNIVHVETAAAAIIDAKARMFLEQFPDKAALLQDFIAFTKQADTTIQARKEPAVRKAITSAVKGIELNAKGEIAKLDADIETSALELAKRFGLKRIWARNLIGMFSTKIDRKDREKFLKACSQGNAIDIQSMLKKGSGHLNDVVNTKLPTIANVFKDVKNTLLDISLSTGQRGATGPFEAVLAIMGGAKKPASNEGGDVVFEIDGKRLKFEVKGGSLTPNTNIVKKTGELSNTGGESSAWLDSTANPDPTKKGGELGGSVLRSVGDEWLFKNIPNWQKLGSDLWYKSDFRSSSLPNLNTFLKALEKRKPGGATALITYMMGKMFPSATTAPGFNFKNSVKKIMEAIAANDARAVAKEQGTMALIEYALGKGNDGFMFFNSSTQEYKTLVGMKDILAVYKAKEGDDDESAVRFMEPMTMARGKPKCSPSVYYGPLAKSNRAKNYFTEFNKSPERVKLYQQMMNAPDPGNAWEDTPESEPNIRRPRA